MGAGENGQIAKWGEVLFGVDENIEVYAQPCEYTKKKKKHQFAYFKRMNFIT